MNTDQKPKQSLGKRMRAVVHSCGWSLRTALKTAPAAFISLLVMSALSGVTPGLQTYVVGSLTQSVASGSRSAALWWAAATGVLVAFTMATSILTESVNLFVSDRILNACFKMVNSTIARISPARLTRERKAEEARQAREAVNNMAVSSQSSGIASILSMIVVCVSLLLSIWYLSPLAAILVILCLFPITVAAAILANVEAVVWPKIVKMNRRSEYFENQITYEQQAHELAQLQGRKYVAKLANDKRDEALKGNLYLDRIYLSGMLVAGFLILVFVVGALIALINNNVSAPVLSGVLVGILSGIVSMASLGYRLGGMAKNSVSIEAFISFIHSNDNEDKAEAAGQPAGSPAQQHGSTRDAQKGSAYAHIPAAARSSTLAGSPLLKLDGLTVVYPGKAEPSVADISFEARMGETIALVGRNGAGKTTTLQAMLGVVPAQGGTLILNGEDITAEGFNERISHFAVMPQEYNRFEFTVRDNLLLGLPEGTVDDAQIWDVLRAVEEESVIRKLPQGLDTQLGAEWGGVGLSGGEWQRLALARMLLRPAPVRVLDEPTSNVDSQSEEVIYSTLSQDSHEHATVLVSHRAWTLQKVDRIYVFRGGRIIETGTYRDLIKPGTYFAELFDYQLNAGE